MAASQAEFVDLDPQGSAELPAASEQSTGSSTSAAVLDLWVPEQRISLSKVFKVALPSLNLDA